MYWKLQVQSSDRRGTREGYSWPKCWGWEGRGKVAMLIELRRKQWLECEAGDQERVHQAVLER